MIVVELIGYIIFNMIFTFGGEGGGNFFFNL
jgi:hypothetical protein